MVARKVMAMFKYADKWNGLSGMDGRRHEIETSAATSAEIATKRGWPTNYQLMADLLLWHSR